MTTPREMAKLFALVAEGKIVNRAVSDEMIALLDRQQDRAMIPALAAARARSRARRQQDRLGRREDGRRLGHTRPHPHRRRLRPKRPRALRRRHLRATASATPTGASTTRRCARAPRSRGTIYDYFSRAR